MNETRKPKSVLKRVYIFIITIFTVGAACIGFYPFHGRDITVAFVTDKGTFGIEVTNLQLNQSANQELELVGMEDGIIEEVRIFRDFRSIVLKKWDAVELFGYVEEVKSGEFVWKGNTLCVTGGDALCFTLNEAGSESLRDVGNSFLVERLMLAESWLVICLMILIVATVFDERRRDTNDNHGPVVEMKKFFSHIRRYRQYMIYAAKADLKAEVADSYLNRLWWLLEPFFNMLVYVIVFGKVMGRSVENYATFVFSSLLMWNYFNKTVNYSVKLIRNNKDIVTKVYVPKFVLLLSNMFLNLFKLFFSLFVLIAMMFIFKVQVGWNLFMVIPAYIDMLLLSFGIGMIFLHYGVYLDDLSYAVNILLNMMMFLSGIFYDVMTSMSNPLNALLICLNPMAMLMDTMRQALLYNTLANVPLLGVWFFISLLLCCIGVHIVYKNENGYVKVV